MGQQLQLEGRRVPLTCKRDGEAGRVSLKRAAHADA
jgi:hypothetical protein